MVNMFPTESAYNQLYNQMIHLTDGYKKTEMKSEIIVYEIKDNGLP